MIKKITGYIKNHFAETRTLIALGELCEVKRFHFELNRHYRDRVMKAQILSRLPVHGTKEVLKGILDYYFSSYIVTTYRNIKKVGIVEISILLGEKNVYYEDFMSTIKNVMPITFYPTILELPFKNYVSNRRQWIVKD